MEITYKDIRKHSNSLGKLFEVKEFPEWKDALLVAELRTQLEPIMEKFNRTNTSIVLKYQKISEKRIGNMHPNGRLEALEIESQETEFENFNGEPAGEIDFPELSEKSIKALFYPDKSEEEKKNKVKTSRFDQNDLSTFMILGIFKAEK